MKVYRVSRNGRLRALIILTVLGFIFIYTGRKVLGLWSGVTAKPTDLILFGLDMNTVVPAFLLFIIAVACIPVGWYLIVELLTSVEITDSGIGVKTPGYRIFYRWSEVAGIDVMVGPQEDASARLNISTNISKSVQESQLEETGWAHGSIQVYLSVFDRSESKAQHLKARKQRKKWRTLVLNRATRPDGRPLGYWMRLLYPQARHPDQILLYPALEDRVALLLEIKGHFSGQ